MGNNGKLQKFHLASAETESIESGEYNELKFTGKKIALGKSKCNIFLGNYFIIFLFKSMQRNLLFLFNTRLWNICLLKVLE